MQFDGSVLVFLWCDGLLDTYQIIADKLPLDMIGIAIAIRSSIIRSRDPQDIENWLSVMGDSLLTATNSGKSTFFAPYEDELFVNSNAS